MKGLEWDDPPQWKKVKPSSSMRVASYEIPSAKGDKETGELNVFVLGGDIEPNIQRWLGEFSGVPSTTIARSDRTVNDMRQAIVEVPSGKFSGGMGDKGERNNYGLLGGIVVAPTGAQYLFKLTGPSATIKAAKKPFYALLDGIREEGSKAGATAGSKPTGADSAAKPAPAGSATKPVEATAAGNKPAENKPAAADKPASSTVTPPTKP
ncbi:MAG: hypothetical protein RL685_1963 [Pseudomonadota bacterium]|jgi:hypothetical protein